MRLEWLSLQKKENHKKQRKKIFGYNQNIKLEIQERRKRCSLWKKEKDEEKQKELEEEYKEQKRKVNDIMDRTEAEEISKIIEKNGRMFDVLKGAFVTPNIQVESCVKGNYRQWNKKIKL